MIFGNSFASWLRQISRLVVWNGLAVVTWIWALPFILRDGRPLVARSSQAVFLSIWIVPGLIVQALIHVAAPGHALASVVALCVLGGYAISLARLRDALLGCALVISAMVFLGFFSIPAGVTNSPNEIPSFKNALLFGTAETSISVLRGIDDMNRTTLKELAEFTPADRPSIIIASDHYEQQFFMNWRVARYYVQERDIKVIYKKGENYGVEHVRRDAYLSKLEGASVRLPVSFGSRILWLIEPGGAVHRQLASQHDLRGGRWVFYTDLGVDSSPIRLDGVEIVPEVSGEQH
jgi:hypothetical protein